VSVEPRVQSPPPWARLSERTRLAQCSDLVAREVERCFEDSLGVRAEFGRTARCPPKAGAPRQARKNTSAVCFPKPALDQVIVGDKVQGGGERCRRDSVTQ
jgi:hypothetical protein